MPAISVVSDANVVLKWFHSEGEDEVGPARALLDAHKERTVVLSVLDLTVYEVGNALMRGRAGASAEQAATAQAAGGERHRFGRNLPFYSPESRRDEGSEPAG